MKSKLKAPGTKRLRLKYDGPLSSFAFNFNLRRYTQELSDIMKEFDTNCDGALDYVVRRCRLNR